MANNTYEEISIKEIHEHILIILQKLMEICDQNEIKYFLAYGSLLGAIRHKGFIPWDDDCDIIMLRPDYDRFVAYCNEHQEEIKPFRLMNFQNTPGYPFGISRLCDMRYRMEREESDSAGMGLFVDIYPYDGMGNGKLWEHFHIGFFRTYYTRMTNYANLNTYSSSQNKAANLVRRPLFYIAKKRGAAYYLKKLEKLARKFPYDKSKYVGAIIWGIGDAHFDKALFDERVEVQFENLRIQAPKQYDEVLRLNYGDYMQLPPEEKRQQTHGYHLYRINPDEEHTGKI